MKENKLSVNIAGQHVPVAPVSKSDLRGVYADGRLLGNFYRMDFQGSNLIVVRLKKHLSPLQLSSHSARLEKALGAPIIFMFDKLETVLRDRLVGNQVYFVVDGKYAFLPTLLINRKGENKPKTDALSPSSQYILLRQLQIGDIDGGTIAGLTDVLPYKYVTISKSIKQLESLGLLSTSLNEKREKVCSFNLSGKDLWDKSTPYMKSPINKVWFSDIKPRKGELAGISALSEYSDLNPDEQPCVALTKDQFKEVKDGLAGLNPEEGTIRIEEWSYPPISKQIVDKLSLYLSLQNDPDPRVEKELELMMSKIW